MAYVMAVKEEAELHNVRVGINDKLHCKCRKKSVKCDLHVFKS